MIGELSKRRLRTVSSSLLPALNMSPNCTARKASSLKWLSVTFPLSPFWQAPLVFHQCWKKVKSHSSLLSAEFILWNSDCCRISSNSEIFHSQMLWFHVWSQDWHFNPGVSRSGLCKTLLLPLLLTFLFD